MAGLTKAQKLTRQMEEEALRFFKRMLEELPEPRRAQGIRYPLHTVVVTALMAMVCGADDAEAMQSWSEANEDWLSEFLDMPHGSPSQDVYLAVFGALNPKAFQSVFRAWAGVLAMRLRASGEGKHLAIDGKTSRRSFDTSSGKRAIHTVSAWLSEAGLIVGQVKTEAKSNEITAIPELLQLLDIRDATVTIDAMGCQTAIAETIVDGGGHYTLAVKDNQPTLLEDVQTCFNEADDERERALDEQPRPKVEHFEEVDKGHGRLEVRTVDLCRDLEWITTSKKWKDLSFVARVVRERTVLTTGKTSIETAYYIGSDPKASTEAVADSIRRHWHVENKLHWVLDVGFREDEARHRAKNTAENMTLLRHFALNIIKNDTSRKLGVANSRKRAGWDQAYLLSLIASVDSTR
jgi:predicted transposase YbfD/YdcC